MMFDFEKNEKRAATRWENVTDFEITQIRDFRESAGVDFNDDTWSFVTVDKPVKGYCDLIVQWDREFDGYLPFQMGYYGYGTAYEALDVAFDTAVNLCIPLDYTTESGQHILL